jgi:uncharacterized protein with FMN-binding domain
MSALSKKISTVFVGMSVTTVIVGCTATGADTDTDSPSSPTTRSAGPSPSGSSSNHVPYKDGTYSVDGEYGTRGSSIGVSITLRDDAITAVDVTPHATNETSLALQSRFVEAVPALVVGRDIDEVTLDRVAGNSHTPDGFNDALEKIKADASG